MLLYPILYISGTPYVITTGAFTTEKVDIEHEWRIGGAAGTRTPCLFNAIEALSQMSYSPTVKVCRIAMAAARFTGGTPCLPDGNRDALPDELQPHC